MEGREGSQVAVEEFEVVIGVTRTKGEAIHFYVEVLDGAPATD